MSRADRIRAAIGERGPLTIDALAEALGDPRRKLAYTVWAMEDDGHLGRTEAGAFYVAREPLNRTQIQAMGAATKRARRPRSEPRSYARPVVRDVLWATFNEVRLPAFNPAPLRWAA